MFPTPNDGFGPPQGREIPLHPIGASVCAVDAGACCKIRKKEDEERGGGHLGMSRWSHRQGCVRTRSGLLGRLVQARILERLRFGSGRSDDQGVEM